MERDVIELQRNSKATCVIIADEEYNLLKPFVAFKSSVSDAFLFAGSRPSFADKIDKKSLESDICYLVVRDIDKVQTELQDRFVGLVKDRECNGYILPENCIIVFTVKDKDLLKNISPNLYHFAVVAF